MPLKTPMISFFFFLKSSTLHSKKSFPVLSPHWVMVRPSSVIFQLFTSSGIRRFARTSMPLINRRGSAAVVPDESSASLTISSSYSRRICMRISKSSSSMAFTRSATPSSFNSLNASIGTPRTRYSQPPPWLACANPKDRPRKIRIHSEYCGKGLPCMSSASPDACSIRQSGIPVIDQSPCDRIDRQLFPGCHP